MVSSGCVAIYVLEPRGDPSLPPRTNADEQGPVPMSLQRMIALDEWNHNPPRSMFYRADRDMEEATGQRLPRPPGWKPCRAGS